MKGLTQCLFDPIIFYCFDSLTPEKKLKIKSILENSSFGMNVDQHFKLNSGLMTGSSLSVSVTIILLSKIENYCFQ